MDRQIHLAADLEWRRQQKIQGATDRAFGRIFDGYKAVIRATGTDRSENIVNTGARCQSGRRSEMLARGALRIGSRWSEIGNFQWLLKCQAGGHDFAKNLLDCNGTKRAGVLGGDTTQNLGFALGSVDASLLDFTNTVRKTGAFVQLAQDVIVDAVDVCPQFRQFVSVVCCVSHVGSSVLQRQVAHGQHAFDLADAVDHL